MTKRSGYERFCSLARGLDIVGERWTLVIIQELLHRPLRYNELRDQLPGIGSNVLAGRLRSLEEHHIIRRTAGAVGEGTRYQLTDRGRDLGPSLAMFRRWALDDLLPPQSTATNFATYNLAYSVGPDDDLHESYQWHIDDDTYALSINGQELTVSTGPATKPQVVVTTSRDFMYRWVAGATNWDQGRATGEVIVDGTDAAWQRMLTATGYSGRPATSR